MSIERATTAGSVVSGILASACCIGPLAFALLGVSGAAFAHRFEPLRPYLLVLTYGLLGSAFYLTYRSQPTSCEPGSACEMPRTSRVGRAMLWIAAMIVVLATTFPWYAEYLPL
jgi:mercuric ion transport protein